MMKSRHQLLVALTGTWLLYICVDTAMGIIRGWYTLKMAKPVRVGYRATGSLRSLLLFGLIALTAALAILVPKREESDCEDTF